MTDKTFLCNPEIGGCGATFRDSDAVTWRGKLVCPECKTWRGVARIPRHGDKQSQSYRDGYSAGAGDAQAGIRNEQHWFDEKILGAGRNYSLGYRRGWTEQRKLVRARAVGAS